MAQTCHDYGATLAGCVVAACPRAALLGDDLISFYELGCRSTVRSTVRSGSLNGFASTLDQPVAERCDALADLVESVVATPLSLGTFCERGDDSNRATCVDGCARRNEQAREARRIGVRGRRRR